MDIRMWELLTAGREGCIYCGQCGPMFFLYSQKKKMVPFVSVHISRRLRLVLFKSSTKKTQERVSCGSLIKAAF